MKKCYICGDEKELEAFSKNKYKKDGRQTACKQCRKEIDKAYYQVKKKTMKQQICDSKIKRREGLTGLVAEFLKKNPCKICGESNIVVLEFDHLEPSQKKFNISSAVGQGVSWNLIKSEIDKCQVLCANCHRFKTAKERNYTILKFT